MIDRTVIRLALFVLIYGIKILTSYVLLVQLGIEEFEKVFKIVSVFSLTNLLFYGFPTGSKTEALRERKGNKDVSYILTLLNFFNFILFLGFLGLSVLRSEWIIPAFVFVTRLAVTFEELKREILDFRYVLRYSLFAELLLIAVILTGISPQAIMGVVAIFYAVTAVRSFGANVWSSIKRFLRRAVGWRPAKLEFSSVLLFGLDVFWASIFMSSEEFAGYFFIARFFSGLTVLFGGLTRNYWAQGFLADHHNTQRMAREGSIIAGGLVIIALVAVSGLLFFLDMPHLENLLNNISREAIYIIIVFQFIFFALQVFNRIQKNRLALINKVLDLADVNFGIALLATTLFAIGYWIFPKNLIYFCIVKTGVFTIMTYYQRRLVLNAK